MEESVKYLLYRDIRYTKIYFEIELLEDTEIVKEKASALRGGMGEMLLRAHCIAERKCENCGFESECIVQRTMYSKFTRLPTSMHPGDSVGYIMHCSDTRRRFLKGDRIKFSLTLLGKNIVYFSQYLNALYALGMSGLGRNYSRYQIVSVKNLYGQQILEGNNVYMPNYKWQTLGEYISRRKEKLGSSIKEYQMIFQTPVSIKYQGQFIEGFSGEALGRALVRRLSILSMFEELTEEDITCELKEGFPRIKGQNVEQGEVSRYSSRKDAYVKLRGIKGSVQLGEPSQEWLDMLLAGEIVHIGKNTSFGFGKYVVR